MAIWKTRSGRDSGLSISISKAQNPRLDTSVGRVLCLAGLTLGLFLSYVPAIQALDAGPAYQRFELILGNGERVEAFGPFHYSEQRDRGRSTWALPPFYSRYQDKDTDSEEYDFLYPMLSFDRYGEQYRWHFIQLFSFAGGPTQTETNRDRFSVFPIYFQQRSADSNENYTAVFPFYGTLKNRLFRDEIFFVAFPAYSKTRKREVETRNYLYPFFHTRSGPGLTGWQAWPLVGHETKTLTETTNLFGEVLPVGGHDKWFGLWPIYHYQNLGLGTTNEETYRALLPAYAISRSPKRDSTSVLWPFFNVIDEREKKFHEWQGPWPFVVIARGPGKTTTRFWPFYAQARIPTKSIQTYLWPVYRRTKVNSAPLDRDRTVIGYFLFSHMMERNTETKEYRKRVDLFPLFTTRREMDGSTRVQVLAILEPFLPNNKSIERNWSPIWAFWRNERNGRTGDNSQSLLWNLYRRESRGGTTKTSALFGLWQREKDSDGTRWRVCFVPFGKTRPAPAPGEARN